MFATAAPRDISFGALTGECAGQVGGRDRRRSGDLPLFRRTLCRLSYPTVVAVPPAVPTGFEPAASGLTGRRALQTAPRDQETIVLCCTPNGIRTRAATLKGWCPRPLDDGGSVQLRAGDTVAAPRCRPFGASRATGPPTVHRARHHSRFYPDQPYPRRAPGVHDRDDIHGPPLTELLANRRRCRASTPARHSVAVSASTISASRYVRYW